MSDLYAEQLEMQLRFAEEESQEREMVAYEQGKADGVREFAKCLRSFVCRENCGERRCVDKMDECVWVGYIDEFLAEYEKEQK